MGRDRSLPVKTLRGRALLPAAAPALLPAALFLIVALLLGCAPSAATATPDVAPAAGVTSAPTATPTAAVVETPQAPAAVGVTSYSYRVINEYPHDPGAFTQGLVYHEGILYEGTGLWGSSSLRRVALETGEVLQIHDLAAEYFGEGIALVGDRIWQITWREQTAFLYDRETFEQLNTFRYPTEGWGLTYDGTQLIMSDGSANLYFRDPETFELLGQVQVHDDQGPVVRLNELEYIDGQVYANVWQTDRIAIINPASGQVSAWIDLTGLLNPEDYVEPVDVLNGIAYDAANERLFVTGKLWPKLFEIELVPTAAHLPIVFRQ
ncbi:MAG: glutaminyl-peptide cyclotransferase [Anaerolineae bacterium]